MKRYRLKKDLPTFKTGDIFERDDDHGNLYYRLRDEDGRLVKCVCAYTSYTLKEFPNIIKDWFEEIPEQPKTVWNLEKGDRHYFIGGDGYIDDAAWDGDEIDELHRSMGNVFLTREDAEKEVARREAKVILERDTKGFRPDWKDDNQPKYGVKFNKAVDELSVQVEYAFCFALMYFATEGDAEASIKAHEKEWKIYLGVEDGD